MSENIVAHPETGLPAREVKTYIELDREQLEQEIADNQADLDELLASKRAEFEASLENDEDVAAARSAVENSKSELSLYDGIAPKPADTAGEEGASSPVESDDEAEDESDESSEPAGDSGDDSGTVNVPVSVKAAAATEEAEEDDEEEAESAKDESDDEDPEDY